MKGIVGKTIGIIDNSFHIIACSELEKIGTKISNAPKELFNKESCFTNEGRTYAHFDDNFVMRCAVFVEGVDLDSKRCANLAVVALNSIRKCQDEKYDCESFIKNLLLDNILPSKIDSKAIELGLISEIPRVCILIRLSQKISGEVYNFVRSLFPNKLKDFVIMLSGSDIVLVKEISKIIGKKDLEKLAKSIVDTLTNEFCVDCLVGIGSSVKSGVRGLTRSFKEAKISLEIGKVFYTEKTVMSYDNLGIARLIYQLPTTSCEVFLYEIFKSSSISFLDDEILFTIQRFFENNLNVSETSRKLFIHRNTLVYRLEKIKKITGLDIRELEDAVVFKVALMVKKYLSRNPVKY
jgi:carbohydrate diacid regulator